MSGLIRINLLPPKEQRKHILTFIVVFNTAITFMLSLIVVFLVLVRKSATVRGWVQALIRWLDC